jgi:hypothetical protein
MLAKGSQSLSFPRSQDNPLGADQGYLNNRPRKCLLIRRLGWQLSGFPD